jgi:ribonuclease HII
MPPKFDPSLIPPFPTLTYEKQIAEHGCTLIAGLDEAGRGALAGPLCAAAVILPVDREGLAEALLGVRDSKQMNAIQRELGAEEIRKIALDWSVAWVEAAEIDALGMGKAGRLVFERAVEGLRTKPGHLLLDYFKLPAVKLPQTSLVKGDQRSLSIACASVLAKTARDALMLSLAEEDDRFGYGQNKGYGTEEHLRAIELHGLSLHHRKSFCEHLLQGRLFD